VELSRDDCGTRRTLPPGDDITVALSESAGTGYSWNLDSTNDFEQLSADTIAPSRVPGAAGTRIFRVVPRRSGQLRLRFVKRRRWEQAAVEECTIDLDVAGPG